MVSDINFLLVGNSRLHWAKYSKNQSKFFHTKKEQKVPENIDLDQLIWASVGKLPNFLLKKENEIKTKDIELSNLPDYFGVDRAFACIAALKLIEDLSLEVEVLQSELSPARMEARYGKLWETNKGSDLDKYHELRKIKPLDNGLEKFNIYCWASGVRSSQTENRKKMKFLDVIRQRLSLRPLLNWTNKDIFYYMEENNLPAHPLFLKGYSSVGDWHSSSPDGIEIKGRDTRFGGIKQECGIHTND